jgi:hypothetical protein
MDSAINQTTQAGNGYAIRIKGTVGRAALGAFPTFKPEFRDGETILTGQLADQSALHGMLAQIEALGLELVELQRMADSAST